MIKFVITPARFADACTVSEYIGVVVGNIGSQMRVLPKMIANDDGSYLVKITHDEDGDIASMEGLDEAMKRIEGISARRFEKLRGELTEAAKSIVNPPNGGG